ncbi:MAG TPA: acyl-CoA dehydrogenase family protein [Solirubrobacteraceae bacterium]|nr:acyl-CoA dehydrogenase family protein [Solirubrobacteraceae bacterium]
MNFAFDETTEAYRASVARFAAERLAPHYQDSDRSGRIRAALREELAAVGLLGLRVPERCGGQEASAVATGAAIEEVARADLSAAYVVLLAALDAEILAGAAHPDHEAGWLADIAQGRALPCLALTEAEHGSDATSIAMRAEPDGEGWALYGEKTSVSLGLHADTAVVFARTGDGGPGGVSAFYVELEDPRVARTAFSDLGSRAIGRAALHFDGLPVGRERLLGAEGEGITRVLRGFGFSRALIGLMCVAAAGASLQEALAWARERRAFGQPIGRFQGVAFPLAEHATFLRAARLLCLEALWCRDAGLDPALPANMAKWWAPLAAVRAAHDALLAFGHAGYSEELPLAQRLRDLIGLEVGDGTAQVAKLVVSRHLLGRSAAP